MSPPLLDGRGPTSANLSDRRFKQSPSHGLTDRTGVQPCNSSQEKPVLLQAHTDAPAEAAAARAHNRRELLRVALHRICHGSPEQMVCAASLLRCLHERMEAEA